MIHWSRESTCQSDDELMQSVQQSCDTAAVLVLDDVPLSALQLAQLSHYRYDITPDR